LEGVEKGADFTSATAAKRQGFRLQHLSLPFDPSTSPSTSSGGTSGLAGSGEPAAWYFIFIVGRFFAPQGEKTTHEELSITGKRTS
jgi:hypothetical protein